MASDPVKPAARRRKQPGFQRIAETLRKEIRRDFKPGDRLPTESSLADRFGVSNLTIRQALTVLAQEGQIDRRQGSGTYVLDLHEARRHVAIYCELDLAHPLTSYYYRRVVRQLNLFLDELGVPNRVYGGFHPAVDDTLADPITCKGFLQDLEMGRITGIIPVATNPHRQWTEPAKAANIPIIGAGRGFSLDIQADTSGMLREVMQYFQTRGRRRIAYFGWGDHHQFEAALIPGLETDQSWIQTTIHPVVAGAGREAIVKAWAEPAHRPDAVLIGDEALWDDFVVGVLQLGIRVPQDLLAVLRTHVGLPHNQSFPVRRIELDIDEFARALATGMATRLEGRNLKRETVWIAYHWNDEFSPTGLDFSAAT